jgi:lysophospholipase L1-like esterase
MGASDAFGIGSYDPDRENWPTQLAGYLPQPTHLVNLGVPGATIAQAQQEELPIATAQHPQILVLWLAVNDIIDDVPLTTYSAQLRATLATLRAASPGTRVFVGNVPDLTRLPFFDGRDPVTLRAEVSAWNVAIAQACADEGATLADIASGWGQFSNHPEYISRDGLHPSRLGARQLAAFFDIVIRQTLNIPG